MPTAMDRSDVFISYSRRDSDFVRQVFERLRDDGREVWVDWEDIPLTVDWWQEITRGIERADTFVFIISPDSVCSEVCTRELDHAVALGKRFVPILHRPIDSLPDHIEIHPVINTHNWVFFRVEDTFETAYKRLIQSLEVDPSVVRSHTNLLVKAGEWDSKGRDDSLLLRGGELQAAETYIATPRSSPKVTKLQLDYVLASRRSQTRRQRLFGAVMAVVAVIMFGLAILSFSLFQQSERNLLVANTSEAVALAAGTEVAIQADLAEKNELRANRAAVSAATSEARALARATEVVDQAATADANANLAATNAAIAATNEQDAYIRATLLAQQVATSDANANLAATNEARAVLNEQEVLLQSTEIVQQAATADANANLAATNAAIAATNEWQAYMRGTEVVQQAATSQANAYLVATNAAIAERNGQRAQAVALSAQSLVADQDNNTDLAVLLAVEALKITDIWDAERALAQALNIGYEPAPADVDLTDEYNGTSPDGRYWVQTGGGNDRIAYIMDSATGNVLHELRGHTEPITRAVWSPSARHVVTLSVDNSARVWDVQRGTLERVLLTHADDVLDAAWSPDDRHLLTLGADQTLQYWSMHDEAFQPVVISHDVENLTEIAFTEDTYQLIGWGGEARVMWQLWAEPDELIDRALTCCIQRDLTDEEARVYGFPPPQSAPAPETIVQCPDAIPSQLYPGVRGMVNSVNNLIPLNVRDEPAGTLIAKIQPDQTFLVTAGPTCADGYAWFRVVYGITGRNGWVAEGEQLDNGDYDYFALPIRVR